MDLFHTFQIFVFNICIKLGNWGVERAMCKILELYDQNPWRNNFPKLATFDPILQQPHSALSASLIPNQSKVKVDVESNFLSQKLCIAAF